MMTDQGELMEKWCSGDHVYGAVRNSLVPGGLHYRLVDGREYPVAQLSANYAVVRWVRRSEPFPNPIPGFNGGGR